MVMIPNLIRCEVKWGLHVSRDNKKNIDDVSMKSQVKRRVMAMRRTIRTTARCVSRVGRSSCVTPAPELTTSSASSLSWTRPQRASGAARTAWVQLLMSSSDFFFLPWCFMSFHVFLSPQAKTKKRKNRPLNSCSFESQFYLIKTWSVLKTSKWISCRLCAADTREESRGMVVS